MRRLILFALSLLMSAAAYAGPFGLEMGMSLSELSKKVKLKPIAPSLYNTPAVPKSHPDFEDYRLLITPNHGLCKIIAWSQPLKTSVYGTELIAKFDSIENVLVAKYGNSDRYDYLKSGSIWNEPRDWMIGLLKKERKLVVYWTSKQLVLPDDLDAISLEAFAVNSEQAMINLSYEFKNSGDCIDWVKSQKDSAL